jgi:predicted transposase/invertase (TIGR01784 family)
LEKAKETLDIMKLGDKERAIYKRREENRMYKESLLYSAKVDGIKEEKKEKAIEIARNLLKANMDLEFISQTTGLSIDEIKKSL